MAFRLGWLVQAGFRSMTMFLGTNLRVTMVDPGLTRTDLFYRLEGAEKRFFFVRWCKSLKRYVVYEIIRHKLGNDKSSPLPSLAFS